MSTGAAVLALALLAVTPAPAGAAGEQLRIEVAREIGRYVPDADAAALSHAQIAEIFLILHSGRSEGEKAAAIRSAIGGPRNSLRDLLFR